MSKSSILEELIRYNKRVPYEERRGLIYCTEQGRPVLVKIAEDMPSFLLGGLSGFGKTHAMAGFCTLVVMAGGRLMVIDPHINAPRDSLGKIVEPLSPWFIKPILDFEDSSKVVEYFLYMQREYEQRKKPNGCLGKPVIFLVVDEWSELLDSLDDNELKIVLKAIRSFAKGGRKFGLFCCLASQLWNLKSTGGAEIRKTIQGRISFNAELPDITMVLGTRDTDTVKSLCRPPLGKGEAIVKRLDVGMQRVRFLDTDVRGCQTVARIMKAVYSESLPISTSENTFSRPLFSESENSQVSTPTLLPVDRSESSNPSTQNDASAALKIQNSIVETLNTSSKNLKISEQELQHIIQEGNKQIAETGKVVRGKIVQAMNGNSHTSRKVKLVCDFLGWGLSMNKDALEPDIWEAIKKQHDYICSRCKRREPLVTLEPDRVVPGVKGGSYEPSNIQCLCKSCNRSKRERIVDYRAESEVSSSE